MAKTPKRLKNARKRHSKSCEGKLTYANRKKAETAATAVREKTNRHQLMAYECSNCGEWHLGKSTWRD